MSSRLSVIFYIILCFEIGVVLTVFPWVPQGWMGLSDWGNNYFLLLAARKVGFYGLQSFMASGWVRGAVSGLGILNLGMAFWEILHFRETVRVLEADTGVKDARVTAPRNTPVNAARSDKPDPLSDYRRPND
jgi:hypothetical protein